MDGFAFVTSITNKHLFEGMKIEGSINFLESSTEISTRIQSISANGNVLRIGFSLINTSEYTTLYKKYLASFCFEFPNDNVKSKKSFGDAITFYRITTDEQYQDVINLRYQAYDSKDKLNEDNMKSLAPGINKEGVIIGGYICGELICSAELKIKNLGHQFLIDKYFPLSTFCEDVNSLMEINRLCIHSNAQKSDVLLTLFRKIHLFSLNHGCKNGLVSATNELKPIYLRLGATDTKKTYPHPTLEGQELHIMYLDSRCYTEARNMNPLAWKYIYEETHSFANSNGLVKPIKFSLKKKVVLLLSQILLNRSKKTKNNSNKKSESKVELKHTKQDFSSQIIYPYIKAATLLTSEEVTTNLLKEFNLSLSYFKNASNWVSIDFFDDFLELLSKKIDLDDLSILAGELAMRKELIGPGYYVLKWFGNINILVRQVQKTTAKLNTNRYVTVESIAKNSLLINIHLKDGFRLPKHSSSDLNFKTLLHHGASLVQNTKKSDIIVDQVSSAYDTKGPSSFKVTWKESSNISKYFAVLSYALLSFGIYHYFPQYQLTFLQVNTVCLLLYVLFAKLSVKKAFNEIDSFYSNVEESSRAQYDTLFNTKQSLEQHHNRLNILNGISNEIHASSNIHSILETTTKLLCERFHFTRCMVMLKDKESKKLTTQSLYSSEENPYIELLWKFEVDLQNKNLNKKVVSAAFHSGQTILIRDITKNINELTDISKGLIEKLKSKSYAIIPISTNEEVHGVIIADKGQDTTHEITNLEVQTLEEISTTLAVAVSKQKKFDDLNDTLNVLKIYNPSLFEDSKLNIGKTSLTGSNKVVVSGFLDVRGFTELSENFPPEVIIEIINDLARLCENALEGSSGHIDKFIGDEFFFTWENQDPEVLVDLAFKTILKIREDLIQYNQEAHAKSYPQIRIGVGLDTGQVLRGNIGTDKRMDYTSIGSSVNKASRLQSLTKEYSAQLIVSEEFFGKLSEKQKKNFTNKTVSIRGFQKDEEVFVLKDQCHEENN